MRSVDTTPHTSSGITTSTTGDRHIPASVRPNGSVRKEIKIRPGYKPPEDVEVYKNRTAESWKTRGSGGVPGAATVDQDGDGTITNNKNAKRREARKRAKAAEETTQDGFEEAVTQTNGGPRAADDNSGPTGSKLGRMGGTQSAEPTEQADLEAEKEKQARSLKKKLRQARELREKKDQGQNLLPEQFEKVIKINELIRQLDSLGFDAEGDPR